MASVPLSAFQGITVNTLTSGISGFTLATPFSGGIITAPLSAGYTQAAITSNYSLIWFWGDGTYSIQYAPMHTYQWPGVYEVKLGIYNSNNGTLAVNLSATGITDIQAEVSTQVYVIQALQGAAAITFSTTVTAYNAIQDNLSWNYSAWPDLSANQPLSGAVFHGYQSIQSGTVTGPIPLTFNYTTSILNNNELNFVFYSDGSLSQPYTEIPVNQIVNLRPRWRFTSASATNLANNTVLTDWKPISSTTLYANATGGVSNVSSNGVPVGLSGSFSFYYIDDIPSLVVTNTTGSINISVQPTTIWVTLGTTQATNYPTLDYGLVPSYSNSVVTLSSYYYVQSFTPDHIGISVNGQIALNSIYWPSVECMFTTTVNSYSGTDSSLSAYMANVPLLNFPINVLSSINVGNTFSITLSSGAVNALSATFNTSTNPVTGNNLQYNLSRYDMLGRDTGGYYLGSFTPYMTNEPAYNAVLYAMALSGLSYVLDLTPTALSGYNPLTIPTNNYTINYNSTFTGVSPQFVVADFNNTYFARKFGANFDFGNVLQSYALQPTIAQNVNFFTYLTAVAGSSAVNDDTFGGVVFEKIANFVKNGSDPFVCNVDQFYSLSEMLGLELNDYNYPNMPPGLGRIFDTYTVQQSRVWGSNSQYARNFALSAGYPNMNSGGQLSAYNIQTTIVSAGQQIVINDMFNSTYFELLQVPAITSYGAITARNLQSMFSPIISAATYPLTAYPLSAFFGWGVQTPVQNFYRFFVYNPTPSNQQVEGLINWNDPLTTLSPNLSSHNSWVQDGGILETIFNYYISKGLGLLSN